MEGVEQQRVRTSAADHFEHRRPDAVGEVEAAPLTGKIHGQKPQALQPFYVLQKRRREANLAVDECHPLLVDLASAGSDLTRGERAELGEAVEIELLRLSEIARAVLRAEASLPQPDE